MPLPPRPRPSLAAGVLGLALLLTGCQSPPDTSTVDQCVPAAPGAASDAVSVTTVEAAPPVAEFPLGLLVDRTERSVLKEGSGGPVLDGAVVDFRYVAYNGSTGELLDTAGYNDRRAQAVVGSSTLMPGLVSTLRCAQPGARVVSVIPPSDAFGDAGATGIGPEDPIVFVAEVLAVAADRATGSAREVPPGLPEVTVGPSGEPRIAVPATEPPPTLRTVVLRKGEGPAVLPGMTITTEYKTVVWGSGQTVEETWSSRQPFQQSTGLFLPGIQQGLDGQTVGSQVLMIIPPAQGYGDTGNSATGVRGSDTLVVVIDILAAV